MTRFVAYLRALAPIFRLFSTLLGGGTAIMSALALLQGEFAPFQSGADIAYRFSVLLFVIFGASALMAIMVDAIIRLCEPRG